MSQPSNPPAFEVEPEPSTGRVPAILKRFARLWVILGVSLILFLLIYTRGGKPPAPPQYGAKAASITERGNVRESPGPGARETALVDAPPAPSATPTPTPPPAVEPVRYERVSSVPAQATPSPLPPQRFQDVFRSGTPDEEVARTAQAEIPIQAPASTPETQPSEQATKQLMLPTGTILHFKLLNPLLVVPSSATHGHVRITRDVQVSDELLIPAGTEGYIAFVKLEGSDRVVIDPVGNSFLIVSNEQYSLTGMLLGGDQFVGLKGKREKIEGTGRPGILKRAAGQAANAATRIAGRVGIYTGDVVDTYGRGGQGQYLVKVPAQTFFTLTCGIR